jgi:hypothetical protein
MFLELWYVSIRPLVKGCQRGRLRIALREQLRDGQRVVTISLSQSILISIPSQDKMGRTASNR